MIIDALGQFNHRCPAAIPTLLDSLRILTAGRSPSKKQEKDWQLTNQTARILSMNLRKSESTDLTALGVKGLDSLIIFVQTHLISHGSRWMQKKAYTAWIAVQERLTTNLYGIITELLRIQSRRDTLHYTDMLQAIADSIMDITQDDDVIIYGFNILSNLNMGQNSSPLDGVILNVLRSRWDRNPLTPKVWAKGHSQRMLLHSAGASFNPTETARLIQLTAEVMRHCAQSSYHDLEERARFLQTRSTWIQVLAIDNMSNWSRISILTTELILNTMAQRQDDPTTFGNCIHTLCLLSSTEENGGRIRDLGGVDKIMNFLPKQFPGNEGEAISLHTRSLLNSNLRFTLRTLKYLTEPYHDSPHGSRTDTGTNLKRVYDTLQVWMGDETSQGLTLQVLYNLIGESDRTDYPTRQDTSPHPDAETDIDPNQNRVREDLAGDSTNVRAQDILYKLEMVSHRIEQVTRNLQDESSQHHITQGMGIKILQALTPRGFTLEVKTPETRDLKWSHPISGTYFDTLPNLVEVMINLTYWHCLKAAWHTQEGTISAPSSGNIIELSRMLLWNHPYVAMKSFLQETAAFHEIRELKTTIPLNTTIRALGLIAQKPKIHLRLPDWEAGHSDLHPRLGHSLERYTSDQDPMNSAWNHDGGEALGKLGNQILGGHKLVIQPACLIPRTRVHVTVIDHHLNPHAPWYRNKQILPHRLRILGNPRSKSMDLQIPMQPGQTCLEVILLALQIIEGQHGRMQYDSEGIQVFTTNHIPKAGPRRHEPTWSEHTGLLLLHHHSHINYSPQYPPGTNSSHPKHRALLRRRHLLHD